MILIYMVQFSNMLSFFAGQIQSVSLTLQNVGNAPLSNLYLVHHSPGLFSLGEQPSTQKRSLFDYPMIQENNTEDESFMDIIPVHLDEPLQVNRYVFSILILLQRLLLYKMTQFNT